MTNKCARKWVVFNYRSLAKYEFPHTPESARVYVYTVEAGFYNYLLRNSSTSQCVVLCRSRYCRVLLLLGAPQTV